MKYYFQSELDNLNNETIKAVEDYTQEMVTDEVFFKMVDEFSNSRNSDEKLDYLDDLAIDLELKQFNLTSIQETIIAYMFINDLFSKEYTEEVMEILEKELL